MTCTDIIIVSYNDKPELEKCLASIKEHCKDYNLIIEDNSSPNSNRLFTKAVNDGIKKGKAEFIWLINSDALILEGAQQALIDRFSYGTQVGVAGSLQLDPDDRDLIRCGGMLAAFPAGSHQGGRVSMGHCSIPSKQKWYNFASAMLSRKMTEKIGLLDEKMALLYSDSDYCYYARSQGYEVWFEPKSHVIHKLKASKKVTEWHEKDMKAFMAKWGITYNPETKSFIYSEKFKNLDMFP